MKIYRFLVDKSAGSLLNRKYQSLRAREPLAERILFSADIPWFSDILNVDATNSTNAEKTYYTEGLQTVLVSSNSSTGNE